MRIDLVSETLGVGGAETFVLRLAAALHHRGHAVRLLVLRADRIDRGLVAALAPGITVAGFSSWAFKVLSRLDGLLYLARVRYSATRALQVKWLAHQLQADPPEVVHSHLMNCDIVAGRAMGSSMARRVSTMHGDYFHLEKFGQDRAMRIHSFEDAVAEVAQRLSDIVCISAGQVKQVHRLLSSVSARAKVHRILNGYSGSPVLRTSAGVDIPAGHFVVGMVSRGIPDKGWNVLIQAFQKINLENSRLLLVGAGEYLDDLKRENRDERIIFCGQQHNPRDFIAHFDVACLPTTYAPESLPTVVVEYLHEGKPVVATHFAEIPAMLEMGSASPAGMTIPVGSEADMIDGVAATLMTLYNSPELRNTMGRSARRAFEKFSMERCVEAYLKVYAGGEPTLT
ncbi:MAG: glycosyltransferase family 4 protein [Pseudomonadota bacterium]